LLQRRPANIRIDFVAAIAADSVTSAPGAIGAMAGADSSGGIDDLFAEILDDITQDLSSGIAAPAVAPGDGAAPPIDAGTKPTASDIAPIILLQSGLADLQVTPKPVDAPDGDAKTSNKPEDSNSAAQASNQDNSGLAQILAAAQQPLLPLPPAASTSPASCEPPTQDDTWSDASDPVLLRGAEDPPPKPARTQTSVDPALFAGTEAVAPAVIAPAAAPTGGQPNNDVTNNDVTPVQPPVMSAAALAADVQTNTAAASMVTAGSVQKPANPAPTAADDSRTQRQGSTAAALAAASTEATRTFADQPASSVLPPNGSGGDSKTDATNPPTLHAPTADPSAATPAVTQAPAVPAPTQPHPMPQADAAATAAVIPPTPAPPHAAAPIAAQLQVLQSDSQDTTPNLAALAVTIASKSADGAKHFDIRLDPPELGRVDVRLTVDDAGRAQAALTVEKPQTLELLQKDSTQLERALKDAGLDLSQNGLNFSLKGQQQQSGSNTAAGRHRHHTVRAIVAADAASTLSAAAAPSSDARLDIRV
jgi:flagellar hook-length control protein FliK